MFIKEVKGKDTLILSQNVWPISYVEAAFFLHLHTFSFSCTFIYSAHWQIYL